MVKTKYISLIFFLLIAATVIKLLQKPTRRIKLPSGWSSLKKASEFINLCSLYGYACPDANCDCENLAACNTNEELVKFRVLEGDSVFVMDKRLLPGTYCLPKGVGGCDAKTSIEFFTLAGWSCVPKNVSWISKRLPCAHPDAREHSLNVLWDVVEEVPVDETTIEDYYETTVDRDGQTVYRYQCRCDSLDSRGKRMVSVLPFTCSVDECIRDIDNPPALMGWNGKTCACGPYDHEIDGDPTSRCVAKKTTRRNDIFDARVECTNEQSMSYSGLHCPKGERYLNFETMIVDGSSPFKFVENIVLGSLAKP